MATRIKRYEAPARELDTLLARIEDEMGPDAELETRHFHRGRIMGMFGGQQMVEVIAVLELADSTTQPAAKVERAPADAGNGERDGDRDAPAPEQTAAPAEMPAAEVRRVLDVTADEPVAPVEEAAPVVEPVPQVITEPVREVEEVPPVVERIMADARRFAAGQAAPAEQVKPAPRRSEIRKAEPASLIAAPPAQSEPAGSTSVPESEIAALRESITDLKTTIELLVNDRAQVEPAPPAAAHATPKPATVVDPTSLYRGADMPATERGVYDRLLDWNIMPMDAIELLNAALTAWDGDAAPGEEDLLKLVFKHICRGILLSEGIHLRNQPPGKVVALVGATGVGKTTTIAKLAAQFAFQRGKRVSLVSLDNYRIAAAEQLRTYSEIMGLDLDIVFSREEFDQVLTARRASDLVLVDTAGRSPVNNKQIYELRDIFSAHPPDEVHLVISASTKADDLKLQLENFEVLSYEHVILSKLDETRSLGSLFNLSKYCRYPISYFTVGQSVPEDVRTASLGFVRTWIEQGRIS